MAKKQYKHNYFSSAFSRILKERKIEQKQFAENTDINQSNISGYATGRTSPTLRQMCKIANYLEIDVVDLLSLGRDILNGKSPSDPAPEPLPSEDKRPVPAADLEAFKAAIKEEIKTELKNELTEQEVGRTATSRTGADGVLKKIAQTDDVKP